MDEQYAAVIQQVTPFLHDALFSVDRPLPLRPGCRVGGSAGLPRSACRDRTSKRPLAYHWPIEIHADHHLR